MDVNAAARAIAILQDASVGASAHTAALEACGPLADADFTTFATEVLPYILRLAVSAAAAATSGAAAAAAPDAVNLRVNLLLMIEQVCAALVRPTTSPRIIYPVLVECIEAAAKFLADETILVRKRFIIAMTNMYPIAFRIFAEMPGDPKYWTVLSIIQIQIDGFFMHPNEGIKANAAKYLSQVIIVQLPREEFDDDTLPSLNIVPANHEYMNSQKLMSDAGTLLNKFVAFLGASNQFLPSASFLSSVINCLHDICKSRAQTAIPLIKTLLEWHRQPPVYLSPPQRKSVMRTVKIFFLSVYAMQSASSLRDEVGEALTALGAKSHELHTRMRREAARMRALQAVRSGAGNESGAWGRNQSASGELAVAAVAGAVDEAEAEADAAEAAEAEAAAAIATDLDAADLHARVAAAPVTPMQIIAAGVECIPLPFVVDVVMRTLAARSPAQWEQDVFSFLQMASAAIGQPQQQMPPSVQVQIPQQQAPIPQQQFAISAAGNQMLGAQVLPMQDYATALIGQIQNQLAFAAQQQMGIYGILTGQPGAEGYVEGSAESGNEAADRMHVPIPLVDVDAVLSNPPELSYEDRTTLLADTIERVLSMEQFFSITTAAGAKPPPLIPSNSTGVLSARFGWMLLVSRIVTRSGTHSDEIRDVLLHFVLDDFSKRVDLAVQWLHEEFLLKEKTGNDTYTPWFHRAVEQLIEMVKSGKSSLSDDSMDQEDQEDENENNRGTSTAVSTKRALPGQFLRAVSKLFLDVPELSDHALNCVASLSESVATTQLGITTLRKLITARPGSRERILNMLLEYSIFPVIPVRAAAIGAIRRFFPEHKAVSKLIEAYATKLLLKLVHIKRFEGEDATAAEPHTDSTQKQNQPVQGEDDAADRGAKRVRREDGTAGPPPTTSSAPDAIADQTEGNAMNDSAEPSAVVPVLGAENSQENAQDDAVWTEADVIRHLELYFVLCSRKHDVFDEICRVYPQFPPFVKRVVQARIVGLLRAMSANPDKLLGVISEFPEGADDVVLKILQIMQKSEHAKSAIDRAIAVYNSKSLDIRFLLVVMPYLDRGQIFREMPKLVGSLDGTEAMRDVVRNVFVSLVRTPEADNAAENDVRKAVLAPAELLIWIHQIEENVGIKSCLEATSICFGLTDIFKQEMLAVVLQQLSDLPKLPTLLMRTAMQSLSANRGLLGFVVNLLLKLISKQVWTNPLLWEGFIRCCTIAFPSSIPILMVLPKNQALELISRSPKLIGDVRQYIGTLQPHQRTRRDIAALIQLMSEVRA